jgi:hypothetical protein
MIIRTLPLSEKESSFLINAAAQFIGAGAHNGQPLVFTTQPDDAPKVLQRRTLWNLARHPEPGQQLEFIATIRTDLGERHIYVEPAQ